MLKALKGLLLTIAAYLTVFSLFIGGVYFLVWGFSKVSDYIPGSHQAAADAYFSDEEDPLTNDVYECWVMAEHLGAQAATQTFSEDAKWLQHFLHKTSMLDDRHDYYARKLPRYLEGKSESLKFTETCQGAHGWFVEFRKKAEERGG